MRLFPPPDIGPENIDNRIHIFTGMRKYIVLLLPQTGDFILKVIHLPVIPLFNPEAVSNLKFRMPGQLLDCTLICTRFETEFTLRIVPLKTSSPPAYEIANPQKRNRAAIIPRQKIFFPFIDTSLNFRQRPVCFCSGLPIFFIPDRLDEAI